MEFEVIIPVKVTGWFEDHKIFDIESVKVGSIECPNDLEDKKLNHSLMAEVSNHISQAFVGAKNAKL